MSCGSGLANSDDAGIENDGNTPTEFGEYQPLFIEGKKWVMICGSITGSSWNRFATHQLITVTVEGEEVIEDIICKKIKVVNQHCVTNPPDNMTLNRCYYCYDVPEGDSYHYVYEKNRKIYVYRDPGPYYEYVEEGDDDLFQTYGSGYYRQYGEPYFEEYIDLNYGLNDSSPVLGKIVEEKYENYGSLNCRTISGSHVSYFIGDRNNWIEGIGSNVILDSLKRYDEYFPMMYPSIMTGSYLVLCTLNDAPLYDVRDKLRAVGAYFGESESTGISVTQADDLFPDDTITESIYSLEGIKVSNPIKGNIYIRNGKKIRY